MCLTYLLFSDFETQIQVRPAQIRTEQPLDIPQTGPAYWIPGMLGVRTSKLDRPFRLLGLGSSSSAPDIDYAKHLRSASRVKPSAPSSDIVDKYSLLHYIIDHWVFHTKEFDPVSSPSRKLQDLAMFKTLPFEFRPWGRNEHYGPYGCISCKPSGASSSEAERLPFMSLLHYAAEAGHWSLMEPLVKDYCFHETKNLIRHNLQWEAKSGYTLQWDAKSGHTLQWDAKAEQWLLVEPLLCKRRLPNGSNDWTMCIAIRNGHELIFERLLLHLDDGFLPIAIPTINAAASSGHETLFRALLQRLRVKAFYSKAYIKDYAHITLALAAANGHQYIVEILLQQGVSFDEQVDMCGETPISAAAANGHDHVVRFLTANGARLLGEGVTPLHRAAEYGHATVASTILQLGKKTRRLGLHAAKDDPPQRMDPHHLLNVLNHEGETPLHQAAKNGHADVVQVMLEHSKESWLLLATTPVSSHKQTALHLAAANGHLPVVRLLRGYGSLADGNGEKPLVLAARGNHVSVVEALVEEENQAYNAVNSALDHAIRRGHYEIVQILLDHYPKPIAPGDLVLAAELGHEPTLELLIETQRSRVMHPSYADTDSTMKLLYKALKQARANKLQEAARLLESYRRQEL
ncbi:MAG: hypothetical protein L6R42_002586 [Xanthoria sp. 1 TBL-2021]|nr:MAG: hypothetical protein L6R42_002586 [Xanthoria sp. 1 TBL-2021]